MPPIHSPLDRVVRAGLQSKQFKQRHWKILDIHQAPLGGKKGTQWGERWRLSGFPSALFPVICQISSFFLIFLPAQLTTKVVIHRGRNWAQKNVLVSYSDGALGRLTDDRGGDEEAELNSPSPCCHPEGRDMIWRRAWTAIRPTVLDTCPQS